MRWRPIQRCYLPRAHRARLRRLALGDVLGCLLDAHNLLVRKLGAVVHQPHRLLRLAGLVRTDLRLGNLAARDAPPTFKALHVVPARSNRVLVFDGTMMHGVPRPADVYINAAGAEGADAPVPSVRRHVVLFNVWDEAPPQRVPLADSERGGVDTDAEGVECACAPRARWGEAAPLEVPRGGEGKRSLKAALLGDSVRRGYAAEAITAAASSDVADAFSERSAPTVVQLDQGLNMALRAAHTLSKIMA